VSSLPNQGKHPCRAQALLPVQEGRAQPVRQATSLSCAKGRAAGGGPALLGDSRGCDVGAEAVLEDAEERSMPGAVGWLMPKGGYRRGAGAATRRTQGVLSIVVASRGRPDRAPAEASAGGRLTSAWSRVKGGFRNGRRVWLEGCRT